MALLHTFQNFYAQLHRLVFAPVYASKTEESGRRVQMVMLLTMLHLMLVFLAWLRFLVEGDLPAPVITQFALSATILTLIYMGYVKTAIWLLVTTYVLSNFLILPISDLTNLLYVVTSFVAVSVLLEHKARLPYMVGLILLTLVAGYITADNPRYDGVTHENVILSVILGILSVTISTSVVEGDRHQIKQQLKALQESEERYRQLTALMSDYAIFTQINEDNTSEVKWITGRFEDITGYDQESFPYAMLESNTPEQDHHRIKADFKKTVEGQPTAGEYRILSKMGEIRWLYISRAPAWNKDKSKVIGVYSVGQDITARKQTEESLRLLDNAINFVSSGITIVDGRTFSENPILYVNDAVSDMTGYKKTDLIGQDIRILYAKDRQDPVFSELRRAMYAHQTGVGVVQSYRQNGTIFWNEIRISPVFDADGRRTHFISTQTDVTDRVNYEASLQAINQELKSFAYIISHDLKAPLRGISSIATWLEIDYSQHFDDDGRQMLTLLKSRIHRMEAMINGVLAYSRLAEPSTLNPIDLNNLVNDIIEDIAPGADCTITIDTPLPVIIADLTHMRQIFQNLIDNAVKYRDKPNSEVRIASQQQGTNWLFSVRDNGQGIEERYFEKIFQIFQTLTPRDVMESTGIGLTIVKRIIEVYGGTIWIESTVGEGTTFFFTLPIENNG